MLQQIILGNYKIQSIIFNLSTVLEIVLLQTLKKYYTKIKM